MENNKDPLTKAREDEFNKISILIIETNSQIEKDTKEKLYGQIFDKETSYPYWQIAKCDKNEKIRKVICTIYYGSIKKEISFWCNQNKCRCAHNKCDWGIYKELNKKIKNLNPN